VRRDDARDRPSASGPSIEPRYRRPQAPSPVAAGTRPAVRAPAARRRRSSIISETCHDDAHLDRGSVKWKVP
jgi:hypothetical protein